MMKLRLGISSLMLCMAACTGKSGGGGGGGGGTDPYIDTSDKNITISSLFGQSNSGNSQITFTKKDGVTDTVTLTDFTFSGNYSNDFSVINHEQCSNTENWSQCTITIQYTPTVKTAVKTVMSIEELINEKNPVTSGLTIGITGQITAAHVTIEPATVNFTKHEYNSSRLQVAIEVNVANSSQYAPVQITSVTLDSSAKFWSGSDFPNDGGTCSMNADLSDKCTILINDPRLPSDGSYGTGSSAHVLTLNYSDPYKSLKADVSYAESLVPTMVMITDSEIYWQEALHPTSGNNDGSQSYSGWSSVSLPPNGSGNYTKMALIPSTESGGLAVASSGGNIYYSEHWYGSSNASWSTITGYGKDTTLEMMGLRKYILAHKDDHTEHYISYANISDSSFSKLPLPPNGSLLRGLAVEEDRVLVLTKKTEESNELYIYSSNWSSGHSQNWSLIGTINNSDKFGVGDRGGIFKIAEDHAFIAGCQNDDGYNDCTSALAVINLNDYSVTYSKRIYTKLQGISVSTNGASDVIVSAYGSKLDVQSQTEKYYYFQIPNAILDSSTGSISLPSAGNDANEILAITTSWNKSEAYPIYVRGFSIKALFSSTSEWQTISTANIIDIDLR